MKNLKDKIAYAPKSPGCYLFYDKLGNIIYVGKAKQLSKRVKNYFQPASAHDERLEGLLRQIADVEYKTTRTELDALILEYRLIKRHKPWFNSQLKPDKPRPYLRIDTTQPYATLSVAIEQANDGADYYQFFTDEDDIKNTLHLLSQVWQTPQCGNQCFDYIRHACLRYSLGACTAPCQAKVNKQTYREAIEQIQSLLSGKPVTKLDELQNQMEQLATGMEFEKAEECKRLWQGLQWLQKKSRKMFSLPQNQNFLLWVRPYRASRFTVFYSCKGKVLYRVNFEDTVCKKKLDSFVQKIQGNTTSAKEPSWLSACLCEILADKMFVPQPENISAVALAKFIEQNSKLFIKAA